MVLLSRAALIEQHKQTVEREVQQVVAFLATSPRAFYTERLRAKLKLQADSKALSYVLSRHPEVVQVKDWRAGRGRATWGHASFYGPGVA